MFDFLRPGNGLEERREWHRWQQLYSHRGDMYTIPYASRCPPPQGKAMALVLRFSPAPCIVCFRRQAASGRPTEVRCDGRSPTPASREGPKSENVVLKLAWYGSELLGIAASLFRSSPPTAPAEEVSAGEIGSLTGRAQVAEAIKEDFARSYFVTGL